MWGQSDEREENVRTKRGKACATCGADDWYIYEYQSSVCASCSRRVQRDYYVRQRQVVLRAYGGCCQCCGEDEEAFLVIDHINGGGTQHLTALGSKLYRWLIKNNLPEGFQVLCANCNMAKQRPGGCPHEHAEALQTTKERESSAVSSQSFSSYSSQQQ